MSDIYPWDTSMLVERLKTLDLKDDLPINASVAIHQILLMVENQRYVAPSPPPPPAPPPPPPMCENHVATTTGRALCALEFGHICPHLYRVETAK